ncbi:MAG: 6,7-dimethyl-8-ribityllumazine synthase [Vicingaceae bacterium]
MSSQDKNLSDLTYEGAELASDFEISIVCAEWNGEVTERLLDGAKHALSKYRIPEKNISIIRVPGSFELPLGAQMILESQDPKPHAVICLGAVIRGETSHFDYVCQAVSNGIKDVGLKYNVPVVFGVLTDDNKAQSLARSGGELGNKGEEAAVTGVKMALLQRRLRI